MIIVSQDKEEIVNFDKISCIYINKPDDCFVYEIMADKGNEDVASILLGKYYSAKKAKEVLEGIIKTHKISESYKYTRDVGLQSALTADIEMRNLILFRYEMPEK
jgi:hypothetical protein